MAWVSTDRAVGSLPCNDGSKFRKVKCFLFRWERSANWGTLLSDTCKHLYSFSHLLRLTISTGAILRTSCCSRVMSQYGNFRMHSRINFSWYTGKPSVSRPFSKLQHRNQDTNVCNVRHTTEEKEIGCNNPPPTSSLGRPAYPHGLWGRQHTFPARSWCSASSWPAPRSCPAAWCTSHRWAPSPVDIFLKPPPPPAGGSPSPASPSVHQETYPFHTTKQLFVAAVCFTRKKWTIH